MRRSVSRSSSCRDSRSSDCSARRCAATAAPASGTSRTASFARSSSAETAACAAAFPCRAASSWAAIPAFGSEEQRSRWLPALARGEKLGCFALTEAHGGSDPASMRTRARRRGSGLDARRSEALDHERRAGGRRHRVGDDRRRYQRVPRRERRRAGSSRASSRTSCRCAHRALPSSRSTDVSVPESARLPEASGLKAALRCLDDARFGIAWGACGAARACIDTVLRYTQSRELFGRPLSHTQLIQTRLADAVRKLAGAQLIAWRLAKLKEQGGPRARRFRSRSGTTSALRSILRATAATCSGAAGITLDHSPMRHMLNLETVITYEGTESIHELIVGREVTGQSAF